METLSALLALCEGNPPVTGGFPSQRPVTRSFDIFCDLRLNKRLSKESIPQWFKTPSHSSWRHCNILIIPSVHISDKSRYYPYIIFRLEYELYIHSLRKQFLWFHHAHRLYLTKLHLIDVPVEKWQNSDGHIGKSSVLAWDYYVTRVCCVIVSP